MHGRVNRQVADADGGEVFLRALHLRFSCGKRNLPTGAAFGFMHEGAYFDAAVAMNAGHAPVRVVVADQGGQIDFEAGWELEVEDNGVAFLRMAST